MTTPPCIKDNAHLSKFYLKKVSVCFVVFWGVLTNLLSSTASAEYSLQSYCLGNAYESCFIIFEGTIDKQSASEFEELLPKHDGPTVYLNSPGGDLGASLKIGRLFRKHNQITAIGSLKGVEIDDWGRPADFPAGGRCESACAYMYIGGEKRIFNQDRLGFHQFYSTGAGLASGQSQIISGMIVEYLVEHGIDPRLFLAASKEDASGMYFISDEEAASFGIVQPTGFGELFMEPYGAGVIVATKRLNATRPYDHVNQATFYCSQGEAKIMLTHDGFLQRQNEGMIKPRFGWKETKEIPEKYLSIRSNESGGGYLTVTIPSNLQGEFLKMLDEREFYVDVPAARAAGGVYWVNLALNDMDVDMIKSAWSHCIS